jgi:hypothetical protein
MRQAEAFRSATAAMMTAMAAHAAFAASRQLPPPAPIAGRSVRSLRADIGRGVL